jgi:hypothetical protein
MNVRCRAETAEGVFRIKADEPTARVVAAIHWTP